MPLPDYIQIPKIPQEFHNRVAFDIDMVERHPEYCESGKRNARRNVAMELYKLLLSEPGKVTITEREFKIEPWEVTFEITVVIE